MRSVVVLLPLACACDSIFHLKPTSLADSAAQFFDAPSDAAFTCSASGVPNYHTQLLPTESTACDDFTMSVDGHVVGLCDFAGTPKLSEGGLTGMLAPIPALAPDGIHLYDLPRMSPDSNELFVRVTASGSTTVQHYTRSGSTWSNDGTVDFASLAITDLSAPSAGGAGRRIVALDGSGAVLYELVDQGALHWSVVNQYTPAALGLVVPLIDPVLAPDGLHLVFGLGAYPAGNDWLYLTARSDLASPFPAAQIITSAPMSPPKFFESGCGRLYVMHNSYLEYVQQP